MSSKLLLTGDYPLIASPTLAQAYGMAAATFLQKLHYCLQNSDAKTHQGKKYWFHTFEDWVKTLGYYSISTIKRIVTKLKDEGILIVKKLSQSKWLQTNYYTIDYKKLTQLFTPQCEEQTPAQPQKQLTIAKEKKPQPTQQPQQTSKLNGTSKPLNPIISASQAHTIPTQIRPLYQALLQLKVDIHHHDTRMMQWYKYQQHIIQHISATKEIAGGIERYQWHTPEQLGLDRFTI